MCAAATDVDAAELLGELIAAGLLIPSGAMGVHGAGPVFEDVRLAVDRAAGRLAAADGTEPLRFPPVFPRRLIEEIGYLQSFPHLLGSVFAFEGDERSAIEQEGRASRHEDWSEFQRMTDLVLLPAACYPVYPAIAARGRLRPGGVTVDTGGAWVFRREPSNDPARLQSFRMHEQVRIGEPDVVAAWREGWCDPALEFLAGLGLDVHLQPASDPFFGRTGRILATSQLQQELKIEIAVPISAGEPTAIASLNYHQDHFAAGFGLETSTGGVAHTACLGFGEERIALALFRTHGFDPADWPAEVRERLWGMH
jgi:seryl-tRNA synthetase